MDSFAEFLRRLIEDGRVAFVGRSRPVDAPDSVTLGLLQAAFEVDRLSVAGPAVPFDAAIALAAGEVIRQACWALVHRGERPEALATRLRMPGSPRSASAHLSADLTLRHLPVVHRRARGLDPTDPLVGMLADLLRAWPLSGVLADLDRGPSEPPGFGGHPGLLLLYAERLARTPRAAWNPSADGMEYVELVTRGASR